MAEEKKYSFITVETDDDDDIVIQAGSPAEPVLEVEEPRVVAEPAPEPVAFEPADDSAAEVVSAQNEAPEPFEAPVVQEKAKPAYRETTLDDLDAAPMGLTQKVVIAVAVVAVIAFAAWYILF